MQQMLQATVKHVRDGLKEAAQPVTVEIDTYIANEDGKLTTPNSGSADAHLKFTITIPAAS